MRVYQSSGMSPCATCDYGVAGECSAPGGAFGGRSHTDKVGNIVYCDRKIGKSLPMVKRVRTARSVYDFDLIETYKSVRHV